MNLPQAFEAEAQARQVQATVEAILTQRQAELTEAKRTIANINSQTEPAALTQTVSLVAALERLIPAIEREVQDLAGPIHGATTRRVRMEQAAAALQTRLARLQQREPRGTPEMIERVRAELAELTGVV